VAYTGNYGKCGNFKTVQHVAPCNNVGQRYCQYWSKVLIVKTMQIQHLIVYRDIPYTAISIKVVHEQSGKVEYERERLLGIAMKIH
jgi:hypothetical protein